MSVRGQGSNGSARTTEVDRIHARARAVDGNEPNFKDLVENAQDIIYTLDLEGRFTFYNHIAWELLGHEPGEFLGRHFTELLTPESADIAVDHFMRALQGEEVSPVLDLEAVKRDGATVHLEIKISNLYRDGQLVGRQGIARDITELKRLRAEVLNRGQRIALLEERNRIARELYDSIADIVFNSAGDPSKTGALLSAMRDSLVVQAAQELALSETDLAIVQLVAQGLSNAEIGREVCLSAHTVKDRVRKIMGRLNVRRRPELVAEAARRGLL